MVSLSNISVHFDGNYLFRNISLTITDKDCIGLVGKNGAGKTTLLRILAGGMIPETGDVVIPGHMRVGYLPQEKNVRSSRSILEEATEAFREIKQLEANMARYNKELEIRTDYESGEYQGIIHKLSEATEKHQFLGGQHIMADTEKVLKGLGYQTEDFQRPLNEFSSGWQMRIELAKILLRKPELMLLDEPTNHLDIESIQWLENFLKEYPGIVILVSHDRAFLDALCKRTVEISRGKFYDYKANYSEYVIMREERLQQQKAAFQNQQREIDQIERFIERFRYKNTKASQVQSRVKMLEKMDKIEVDEIDQSAIHFRFPPAPRSGKVVFSAKQLSKSYDEKQVLKDLSFNIGREERIAFVGKNGEGKTTLSKIIVKQIHADGEYQLGYNVSLGYFAQNTNEMLDMEKTVMATLEDVAPADVRPKVRNILGNFLFSGEDIDKKVKVLSGGEKARLAMAKLLLAPANFLVLDEPTNHLDMRSKDILKNALLQFDGTVVIVSHDREFLHGLTDKVFEFKNMQIREYPGDIYEFLENRRITDLKQLEKNEKHKQHKRQASSVNKINYQQKKIKEKEIRKISNQIKKLENKIEDIENHMLDINELLEDPIENKPVIEERNLYQKYELLKSEIAELMTLWEKKLGEKEEIEGF